MLTGLLLFHSLLRYIILVLLLVTIFKSFSGWFGKKNYLPGDKKVSLFTFISAHTQLILGLLLYFISPNVASKADMGTAMKDPIARFWTIEHVFMMVLAIILITLGYMLTKRAKTDKGKHMRTAIFYLLALLVIFLAIPWPWAKVARGWLPGM
ncbi:MAG: cytochrome B [Bacteroidetes bacterium]|nr:cytochrome B [Bacteroidota bacterium]